MQLLKKVPLQKINKLKTLLNSLKKRVEIIFEIGTRVALQIKKISNPLLVKEFVR